MKHISVLVPKGDVIVSSVVGAFKIFNWVNLYLKETGKQTTDYFQIDLVGISKETALYNGCFVIRPNKQIHQVKKTDLIIVSTIAGDYDMALKENTPLINWIKEQRKTNNCEIASLCTGAFLLAETGLLNGKSCATHWLAHSAFRERFPEVNLLPDKIISEADGIYSSGGAFSFLNLILHLVEKFSGRATAIACSKIFEIEFGRSNQNEFIIFNAQKGHQDEPIKQAQEYIECNVHEKISIEDLAKKFAISRRNFVRRFKKATHNTPLEYVQRVKIEAAKKQFENSPQNISEVMYSVGYNDTKAFRTIFKKYTGLSPLDYRLKYNREMAMAYS